MVGASSGSSTGGHQREDVLRRLHGWLDPLKPHYSKDCSRLFIGNTSAQYEDEVIPIESWARPLWGLAPMWAGGSRDGFFEEAYARGLVAGTDPSAASYWGDCRDHDQRFVEMAAIAYGLLLAPEVLWDPLSEAQRANVASWLAQINQHECPEGNWLLFRALVNAALKSLGEPFDETLYDEALRMVDSFYLGGGWYKDGPSGVPDYYVAFVFEAFGVILATMPGALSSERAGRWLERARAFGPQLALLFSGGGQGVPYGRSMTYRFAQCAFFSFACARGVDVGVDPSCEKGIILRCLDAWDPARVCDSGGVMTIGYDYPNLHIAEGYNAPGSPLWALMAFAVLALPERDPFWEMAPEPLGRRDGIWEIALGRQLVQRCCGDAVLYPDGVEPGHPFAQAAAKYSKFAYSTRFGFSVSRGTRTLADAAPDSMLAFVVAGHVFVREQPERAWLKRDDERAVMVSEWSPFPGIAVRSEIEPLPGGAHVRRHLVDSKVTCEAYDCGFSVPGDYHSCGLAEAWESCRVTSAGEVAGEPLLIHAEANTNLRFGKTVIPAVHYHIEAGKIHLVTMVEVR